MSGYLLSLSHATAVQNESDPSEGGFFAGEKLRHDPHQARLATILHKGRGTKFSISNTQPRNLEPEESRKR